MRSRPASYSHLATFLLPKGARAGAGILEDSPHHCVVEIGRIGLVSIMGGSREAVFDQAARILLATCDHLPPLSIALKIYAANPVPADDGRDWLRLEGATDSWTIILNAPVAFSPTGIDPHFPAFARQALAHEARPPPLSIVKGSDSA